MSNLGGLAIGIDPGHRETGIIGRFNEQLIWGGVEFRNDSEDWPPREYINGILDAIDLAAARLLEFCEADHPPMPAVYIEGLVAPHGYTPSRRRHGQDSRPVLMNVASLMGTAMVYSAVIACLPSAVVIEPGGHGSGPFSAYPLGLHPIRGNGKGHDQLRHCRSAWDIAGTGMRITRMRAKEVH